MDGNLLSFIGILVGVGIFIAMAFKGFNLVLSACVSAFIMILTSGMPVLEMVQKQWATGFSGYLKSYFLIFSLGSLFGKMMGDGGGAKRIAISLYKLFSKSKGNPKFWGVAFVPAMYAILTYAGISGLVVVYTVLDISQELFQRLDCPWRLYCNGGTASIGTFFLGGSLQIINIAPMVICGTSTTAGMGLSVIASVIFYGVMAFFIKYDLKQAEKNGEGYMKTGAAFIEGRPPIKSIDEEDTDNLPNIFVAITPMVVMIGAAGIFHINILISLMLGIILCAILFKKNYTSLKATVGNGISGAYTPIIGVAATSAIAAVIKAVPGFAIITSSLGALPPLYEGIGLISLVTFITASGAAAIDGFGADAFAKFTEAGLSAQISHRLMTISTFTGVPPHSAGIANATSVAKIDYNKGVIIYLRTGLIGGGLALIVAVILIKLGIFI